jgi:hypothetical protein
MSEAKTTRDHDTIRRWAEQRGGKPSAVSDTSSPGDPGILRLDFAPKDQALDVLTWGEFFEKFDEAELSFLYQDETRTEKRAASTSSFMTAAKEGTDGSVHRQRRQQPQAGRRGRSEGQPAFGAPRPAGFGPADSRA